MAWVLQGIEPLTCEDVWAMPDDGRRRELIDGALIVTPSPGFAHQRALFRLACCYPQRAHRSSS